MKRTHDSSELYFNSVPYSPIPHRYQLHPYIFYRSSLAKWKYLGRMVAKPSIVGRRPTELDVTPTAEIQFFFWSTDTASIDFFFEKKKKRWMDCSLAQQSSQLSHFHLSNRRVWCNSYFVLIYYASMLPTVCLVLPWNACVQHSVSSSLRICLTRVKSLTRADERAVGHLG